MQIERKNTKWIILALILVLVLILATHHSCQRKSNNHQVELANNKIQITFHGKASSVDIYDNIIVWADARNKGDKMSNAWGELVHTDNYDIYMYDLVNRVETRITTDTSRQLNPAIYGSKIVWEDYRNQPGPFGKANIYMYDINTKIETRITADSWGQSSPDISDQAIVWKDYGDSLGGNIRMYDLNTGITTQITTNSKNALASNCDNPRISGSIITWTDFRNDSLSFGNDGDIYSHDIHTNIETQITTKGHSRDAGFSSIHNNKIAYVYRTKENDAIFGDPCSSSLYMYNLETKTEKRIVSRDNLASKWNGQGIPDIHDNKIVWADDRNPNTNFDIYIYDLDTDVETRITTNDASQIGPAIYDDKIVWEDRRDNQSNIYFYRLVD